MEEDALVQQAWKRIGMDESWILLNDVNKKDKSLPRCSENDRFHAMFKGQFEERSGRFRNVGDLRGN
jgi:hypothetical protein